MASESTEEGSLTVNLPPELEEWLDARAGELDVDRETVLVRLVSSYRDAAALDGAAHADELAAEIADAEPVTDAIESTVDEALDDHLADRIDDYLDDPLAEAVTEQVEESLGDALQEEVDVVVEEAVADEIAAAVDDAIEERLEATVEAQLDDRLGDAVDEHLDDRLESVRDDFREKLEDVRERVIQVKKEADAKAPADHDHDALARVDALGERVVDLEESLADVEAELSGLADDLESAESEREAADGEIEATVDDLEERLKTVAWVVSDLRETFESPSGTAALDRLKRGAAQADVSRAQCERCGQGVEIGLLTEPKCPHCDATVTNVAPSEGFFGKPQLLVAAQLESGEGR